VVDSHNESRAEEGAFASLWRRAPLWRVAAVGAAVVTLAALVLWAESQHAEPQGFAVHSVEPLPVQNAIAPAVSPGVPDSGPPTVSLPHPVAVGPPAVAVAPAIQASDEEEQILATCHPHLVHAPSMPQIDVANVPAPNLGHIKMHFWVNGSGAVTRETVTAATLGTPAEQQAEVAFANQLTFALPNTRECRSREVEVIGDFFEQRAPSGQWSTYVRLYPRLTFGTTGALQRAE
jgi:hypothetical protein